MITDDEKDILFRAYAHITIMIIAVISFASMVSGAGYLLLKFFRVVP